MSHPKISKLRYLETSRQMCLDIADELEGSSTDYRIGTILTCGPITFMYNGFKNINSFDALCYYNRDTQEFKWRDDEENISFCFYAEETRPASTVEIIDFIYGMRSSQIRKKQALDFFKTLQTIRKK